VSNQQPEWIINDERLVISLQPFENTVNGYSLNSYNSVFEIGVSGFTMGDMTNHPHSNKVWFVFNDEQERDEFFAEYPYLLEADTLCTIRTNTPPAPSDFNDDFNDDF